MCIETEETVLAKYKAEYNVPSTCEESTDPDVCPCPDSNS